MSEKVQHWSSMQERGSLLGMRILLWVYRLAGRHILLIVLFPVVLYFYLTGSSSRRASQRFLQRAHAIDPTVPVGWWAGLRHFLNFASSAFDKIDAWLGRINNNQIEYQNKALFNQLKNSQKGAVFIGSHLGNLELCRAMNATKYNAPINVLVFTHHAIKFNQLLRKINPAVTINMIEVSHLHPGLMISLKEKIDAGESLVIVGDRTSTSVAGRSCNSEFLGHKAAFSQGPFILAALLECPIYLLFCCKQKNNYLVIFEHFRDVLVLPRKQRQQLLQETIDDYARRLQHYALQFPLQWYNFFDFWQQDVLESRQPTDNK